MRSCTQAVTLKVYLPSSSVFGSVQMMEHLPDSVNFALTSPFLVVVTAQTSLLSAPRATPDAYQRAVLA